VIPKSELYNVYFNRFLLTSCYFNPLKSTEFYSFPPFLYFFQCTAWLCVCLPILECCTFGRPDSSAPSSACRTPPVCDWRFAICICDPIVWPLLLLGSNSNSELDSASASKAEVEAEVPMNSHKALSTSGVLKAVEGDGKGFGRG